MKSFYKLSSKLSQKSVSPLFAQRSILGYNFSSASSNDVQVVGSPRQLCDLELLSNGGFAQLSGFMNRKDYDSVCKDYRLADGRLWSIPIYFDVDENTKNDLEKKGGNLHIQDARGVTRAILKVEDIWEPSKDAEGKLVYGGNPDHCEIINIKTNINKYYVGGSIQVVSPPEHDDFQDFRWTPAQVKEYFKEKGWTKIVAFQTRNPMHYAHIELTKRAQSELGAKLFLNPVVGPTKPGDIDYVTRMSCYDAIIDTYAKDSILLKTLPLAMRMGGPREAMLHALIRKNYGCTHLICGRDHAGPGSDRNGDDIYGAFDARDFVVNNQDELGINAVAFDEMVYHNTLKQYFPKSQFPKDAKPMKLSGTEVRRRLGTGEEIPEWFSPPKVVAILRKNAADKKKAAEAAKNN